MATAGKGPLVRPHQLLDACARSPIVRERYRDLVKLSVGAVAGLVKSDQDDGAVRSDVDPETVATMALALVIGAQTMNDLGLALDPARLASAIEHMLASAEAVARSVALAHLAQQLGGDGEVPHGEAEEHEHEEDRAARARRSCRPRREATRPRAPSDRSRRARQRRGRGASGPRTRTSRGGR